MDSDRSETVLSVARAARHAGHALGHAAGPERRSILLAMADALQRRDLRTRIRSANDADVAAAQVACAQGTMSQALVDRLSLGDAKIESLCTGVRQLAGHDDPVGVVQLERQLDTGLELRRVTCPLGVIAVVFEARPDAVPQIVGLAMRSGNAVVLKGGKEAARTNAVLVEILRGVIADQGFDPAAIALLEARTDVDTVITLKRDIDLVVARGSGAFVRHVQQHSLVPVLAHAEGVCHLFLHRSADPAMAAAIAEDAKAEYPAACNSIETLLWEPGAEDALRACIVALKRREVQMRACSHTLPFDENLIVANPEDFGAEFSGPILAIRRVDDLAQALAHIDQYGSRHTEAIVANDAAAAAQFQASVDAACVFHNVSTRFADGYRLGLGAEVGVSTSKLHARGPVGADSLVTYRWLLRGHGQVASAYGPGKRHYLHQEE